MLWVPWQLAQLATTGEPPLTARPWKLSKNVPARCGARPNSSTTGAASWQAAQVLETVSGATRDFGARVAVIPCSPWQSVHVGAANTPRETAPPCTLSWNCAASSSWQ